MRSFWEALDSYYEAELATALGIPVVVAEQFDPDQATLPLALVRSYEGDFGGDEMSFGDGSGHLNAIEYTVELSVTDLATDARTAKRLAQNWLLLLRDFANDHMGLPGVVGTDGEQAESAHLRDFRVVVRGRHGQNQNGKVVSAAVVAIGVVAHT